MAVVVNRGAVHVTIPNAVKAGMDKVSANLTKNLIGVILTFMNERDSILTLKADPRMTRKIKQLNGIVDRSKENALNSASTNAAPGKFVYASDISTMITYANELVSTMSVHSTSYETKTCDYVLRNKTLIKIKQEIKVPDQPKVDPITGETQYDADGNVIMIPGFKNPIPVLDANGKPTYYTVTKQQIFTEGPVTNEDETQVLNVCGNTGIACVNRSLLKGWKYADSSSTDDIPVCTNDQRNQLSDGSIPLSASKVSLVNKDELIKADTFNLIIANLIAVNGALESYADWWGAGGGCSISCQNVCQAICQSACQSACQNACQATCQHACQAVCLSACQVACEISCEIGCQVACQDSCQSACQNACQYGCQLVCQTACQDACQLACQHCHGGTCHNQNCGGFS